jgi:Holliday junction resolvase
VTESAIQQQIMDYLKREGWDVVRQTHVYPSGTPDLYSCKDGRVIWWEVKSKYQSGSHLQLHRIEQKRKSGVEAYVVYSLDEVKEHIDK